MSNSKRSSRASGGSHLAKPDRNTAAHHSAPKRKTKKRPIGLTILIRFLQVLGTLALVAVVTVAVLSCYAVIYVRNSVLPNTSLDLSAYTLNENSVIYYKDNETGEYVELTTLVGEKDTEWVNLEDIPEDLINAVVSIEDKTFWEHHGVNWRRTAGAIVNMFFSMSDTYGGSTITQQLIKNMTQYDDVTVSRKIQEIFTALELERNYSKEEILELYLNIIYLGDNCYGVQSAAQKYFGKDVWDLSLAECASLAGITNNPSLYGPNSTVQVTRYECRQCGELTNTESEFCPSCGAANSLKTVYWTARDYNKQRQELILTEMAKEENGYITEAECERAMKETLVFADDQDDDDGTSESSDIYSWYVDAVISEVIDDLMESTQLDKRAVTNLVYNGGLSIYTNYDPEVQAAVDEIYNDRSNLDYTSQTGQQMKSAITVIDNSTGYVVALAGDIGEKTGNRLWNYATDSPFQPGSSFKPLSVYAPALEMGLITPATVIDDNPLLLDDEVWPRNDTSSYKGLTTIQTGIANSLNTISVRTLMMVTPEASYEFLTDRFGFTTLEEGVFSSSGEWQTDIALSPLAMGGLTYGVTTMEMAAAYASFPRNGLYTEPTTYLIVENNEHEVILDNTPETTVIMKESTAYYINQLLTNAVETGTGTPARISGMTVAGKTGTTSNSYARWFAGYTPYYTAVVWVGYETNEEIVVSGNNPAVVLWQEVMSLLHEDLEDIGFESSVETTRCTICLDCGKLAVSGVCDNDSRGNRTQTFTLVKGDEPVEYCTCHVPIQVCTDSPILDENGNSTGMYYWAGELCPEESLRTVYVVNYDRDWVTEYSRIGDYTALLSYYDSLEDPYCPVHNGEDEEDEENEENEDEEGEEGEEGEEPEEDWEIGEEGEQSPMEEPSWEPEPAPSEPEPEASSPASPELEENEPSGG